MKSLIHDKFGYSILELLIGLVILSTVSLYGSLSFIGFKEDLLWHSETEKILRTLKFAQLEAFSKEIKLTFRCNQDQYSVISESNNVVLHRQLPEEMHFSNVLQITFYASGMVSPQTLTLTYKRRTCRIITSLRGRIRKTCITS